jgi:hypothetical protein
MFNKLCIMKVVNMHVLVHKIVVHCRKINGKHYVSYKTNMGRIDSSSIPPNGPGSPNL